MNIDSVPLQFILEFSGSKSSVRAHDGWSIAPGDIGITRLYSPIFEMEDEDAVKKISLDLLSLQAMGLQYNNKCYITASAQISTVYDGDLDEFEKGLAVWRSRLLILACSTVSNAQLEDELRISTLRLEPGWIDLRCWLPTLRWEEIFTICKFTARFPFAVLAGGIPANPREYNPEREPALEQMLKAIELYDMRWPSKDSVAREIKTRNTKEEETKLNRLKAKLENMKKLERHALKFWRKIDHNDLNISIFQCRTKETLAAFEYWREILSESPVKKERKSDRILRFLVIDKNTFGILGLFQLDTYEAMVYTHAYVTDTFKTYGGLELCKMLASCSEVVRLWARIYSNYGDDIHGEEVRKESRQIIAEWRTEVYKVGAQSNDFNKLKYGVENQIKLLEQKVSK